MLFFAVGWGKKVKWKLGGRPENGHRYIAGQEHLLIGIGVPVFVLPHPTAQTLGSYDAAAVATDKIGVNF